MFCQLLITLALTVATADRFAPAGVWTVDTGQGPATLVLELGEGDTVSGKFLGTGGECAVSGMYTIDEDDEASVEGAWQCAQGGAEFEFYFDEDTGYEILVIPVDADGTPHGEAAEFWIARRGPPHDSGSAAPALVGVWSTQVIMNSPEGSIATQLLMELRADGTLVDLGSRSVAGGEDWSGNTGLLGAGESAKWRTDGDVLEISDQGSPWVPLARYALEGNRLGLAWYDGTYSVWHRQ